MKPVQVWLASVGLGFLPGCAGSAQPGAAGGTLSGQCPGVGDAAVCAKILQTLLMETSPRFISGLLWLCLLQR